MSTGKFLRWAFDGLASVGFAIPLLVLLAIATILGGLIPQGENVQLMQEVPAWVLRVNTYLKLNDLFHAWWYVTLLGLLCLSLLAVTLKRVPATLHQRGRGFASGILLVHIGMLFIVVGLIYGGITGFRYYVRVGEGDVKVVPSLPFVIKFDQLTMEYYPPDAFGGQRRGGKPLVRRQDSELSLYSGGKLLTQIMAAPGKPAKVDDITLLPSQTDTGWVFSLILRDPTGREKVIPIEPWAAPLTRLGLSNQHIFVHEVKRVRVKQGDSTQLVKPDATEVFLLDEGKAPESLGYATEPEPLTVSGYTVFPWDIRPYTGLHIYRRPGTPLLVAGLACLMIGLLFTLVYRRASLAPGTGGEDCPPQEDKHR